MARKLFKDDEVAIEEGRITREGQEIDLKDINLDSEYEHINDYTEVALENLSNLEHRLSEVYRLQSEMKKEEVGTKEYLYGLESRNDYLKSIARSLGVTIHVASLEDFNSKHSMQASHEVALEGITDVIRNIWAKIKAFFAKFFKKIMNFLKRISGANLELDAYEKYVEDIIRRIESRKLELKSKTTIHTKLPEFTHFGGSFSKSGHEAVSLFRRTTFEFKDIVETRLVAQLEMFDKQGLSDLLKIVNGTLERISTRGSSVESVTNDMVQSILVMTDYVRAAVGKYEWKWNELPDDVQDKFEQIYDRNTRGQKYFSLLNHDTKLPKDAGLFVSIPKDLDNLSTLMSGKKDVREINDEIRNTYTVGVASYTDRDGSHLNELEPIETIGSLKDMYSDYKKFKINYKRVDSLNTSISKKIDSIINLVLDSSKGDATLETAPVGLRDRVLEVLEVIVDTLVIKMTPENVDFMVAISNVFSPEYLHSIAGGVTNSQGKELERLHKQFLEIAGLYQKELVGERNHEILTIGGGNMLNEFSALITTFRGFAKESKGKPGGTDLNEMKTAVLITQRLAESLGNKELSASLDEIGGEVEDISVILGTYSHVLIKSLNMVRDVLQAAVGDFTKLYTDLRYEAIRYMYESGKQYS